MNRPNAWRVAAASAFALLAAMASPGAATADPIGTFETEVGCSKNRALGSDSCRKAFALARAEFEANTKLYGNRLACYRAFGPCSPWPLHSAAPNHFRPQWMGVTLLRQGTDIVALPVIASGKLRVAFVARSLSSEIGTVAATSVGAPSLDLPSHARVANLQALCSTIATAAAREKLPAAFLTRLLWQESSFRSGVTSPAGAQGIAQFMPGTAQERGLDDPFDSEKAIRTSAALLSDLTHRFGNLGLAAAAYNGGPARVAAWLQGNRGLADETRDYVARITGRSVDDWAHLTADQWQRIEIPDAVLCRPSRPLS